MTVFTVLVAAWALPMLELPLLLQLVKVKGWEQFRQGYLYCISAARLVCTGPKCSVYKIPF